ncbi:MAG: hypothetical protein M1504_01140 [Candidatus Marsarchaeota archaeon]|nr:hypothetical protein [Candidatus Marsarchaeota archaeon]
MNGENLQRTPIGILDGMRSALEIAIDYLYATAREPELSEIDDGHGIPVSQEEAERKMEEVEELVELAWSAMAISAHAYKAKSSDDISSLLRYYVAIGKEFPLTCYVLP